MKLKLSVLASCALFFVTIASKAQITDDPSYTPKVFINANILEYKLGGQFDGFNIGLDPVYNLNDRIRINGWFDMALLDGKIKLRDVMDNQNELKKYRKLGAGIMFKLFETKGEKTIKFILSVRNEGNTRITRYVEEEVPFRRQYGIRTGIENYRFIAEPTEKNATVIDNGVSDIAYLVTPGRQLIWYEGISNWHMNVLYAGLSRTDSYSVKVKNSYGEGTMARYMSWYADLLLPVTLRVDDVLLNNSKIPVKDAYKKNPFGARIGVSTVGMFYVKIECGSYPGIKPAWFFNTAMGWTFKAGQKR